MREALGVGGEVGGGGRAEFGDSVEHREGVEHRLRVAALGAPRVELGVIRRVMVDVALGVAAAVDVEVGAELLQLMRGAQQHVGGEALQD